MFDIAINMQNIESAVKNVFVSRGIHSNDAKGSELILEPHLYDKLMRTAAILLLLFLSERSNSTRY